jgi:hypothetical protein
MKRFEVSALKGKLRNIRDWMQEHHFPPRMLFILMGVISTIWFLLRVIPKPSRAGYPCMQVAAPLMSGFVVYLLSLGGITLAFRRAKQSIAKARYLAAGSFIIVAIISLGIILTNNILLWLYLLQMTLNSYSEVLRLRLNTALMTGQTSQ